MQQQSPSEITKVGIIRMCVLQGLSRVLLPMLTDTRMRVEASVWTMMYLSMCIETAIVHRRRCRGNATIVVIGYSRFTEWRAHDMKLFGDFSLSNFESPECAIFESTQSLLLCYPYFYNVPCSTVFLTEFP